MAVTAFTAEALDKLNVEDLSDLGGQVPNLTIYAARGASSTVTAYIRGVGPVSYTHLDVYKRQPRNTTLTGSFDQVSRLPKASSIALRATSPPMLWPSRVISVTGAGHALTNWLSSFDSCWPLREMCLPEL